ncbi:MAG: efflux RND transporter permease subunit [Verrucomicrobia bacterium]|nr:efflux RND transporter permease subunit [Verrucomicrobiota bacterium]
MGVTLSYLSVFGMLGLAGVAVNDSIVLVDYINQRRAEGKTLREAALEAGARRFRPILLTSAGISGVSTSGSRRGRLRQSNPCRRSPHHEA